MSSANSIKTPESSKSIDVANTFFMAYNLHDVNRIIELCAEDAELRYVPMADLGVGRVDRVGRQIWSGLLDVFPICT